MKKIKKNYIILFIFVLLFCNINKLFSIVPEGLYIAPKFVYLHDGNNIYIKENKEKAYFNYIGGGFSFGLAIPSVNKSSPIRFEFEYLVRKLTSMSDNFTMHTFLGSMYFDLNFFMIKEKLTDESYRETLLNKYPPFTIYLGISLGGILNNSIYSYENKIKLIYSKSTLVLGLNGGMAFNLKPYISLDIGYRFLLDMKLQMYHEILLGIRFKFPKL